MKGILNLPEDTIEMCKKDMEQFGPILKKQGKIVNYEFPPAMRLGSSIPVIIKIGKKSYQAKHEWIKKIEQES